jgi:hypothetical protein
VFVPLAVKIPSRDSSLRGVLFLHAPVIMFDMLGQICTSNQTRKAAVYHSYPIFEGGVASTFSWRRREVE